MIRKCIEDDFKEILHIINDSSAAYKGIIPADRWKEPYMPEDKLRHQMEQGVKFYGEEEDGSLTGVMGIQDRGEVTLIRHAYVRTQHRGKGTGARLLQHLTSSTTKPVLIGTWAATTWAIAFYRKQGFRLVSDSEKDQLLRRYWTIPERQIETSVVLTNSD